MKNQELTKYLNKLGVVEHRENEYTVYELDSENGSTMILQVYLYDDGEAYIGFKNKLSPEIKLASGCYEMCDYDSNEQLLTKVFSDIKLIVNEGVECHIKNGVLFQHAKAILLKSKHSIFNVGTFKFGGFNLTKNKGLVGVFKPINA